MELSKFDTTVKNTFEYCIKTDSFEPLPNGKFWKREMASQNSKGAAAKFLHLPPSAFIIFATTSLG